MPPLPCNSVCTIAASSRAGTRSNSDGAKPEPPPSAPWQPAHRSANVSALVAIKKHHPNKTVIVLEPDATVTVADLVAVIAAVRAEFPRIVLGAGQRIE